MGSTTMKEGIVYGRVDKGHEEESWGFGKESRFLLTDKEGTVQ